MTDVFAWGINRSSTESNNLVEMWRISKRQHKRNERSEVGIRKLIMDQVTWCRLKVGNENGEGEKFQISEGILTCTGGILGSFQIPIASAVWKRNIRMPGSSAELASYISFFQNPTRCLVQKVSYNIDWELICKYRISCPTPNLLNRFFILIGGSCAH